MGTVHGLVGCRRLDQAQTLLPLPQPRILDPTRTAPNPGLHWALGCRCGKIPRCTQHRGKVYRLDDPALQARSSQYA